MNIQQSFESDRDMKKEVEQEVPIKFTAEPIEPVNIEIFDNNIKEYNVQKWDEAGEEQKLHDMLHNTSAASLQKSDKAKKVTLPNGAKIKMANKRGSKLNDSKKNNN